MRVSLFDGGVRVQGVVPEEEARVQPEEWEAAAAREERGQKLVWAGQGQNR
jgi:hypothetical protein